MTCIERAPVSLDEWVELVKRCAEAAGGPGWETAALTGAAVVVVIAIVLVTIVSFLRAASR
jgi:hypothetical protein